MAMRIRPMAFRWLFLSAGLLTLIPSAASASTADLLPTAYVPAAIPVDAVWVSPTGSDLTGNGSRQHPFFTPARAAENGRTVVLEAGRYPSFGTVTHGGTDAAPLVIRAATGTVTFALQDARVPATIAASHVRLEGLEFHGFELERPGTCVSLGPNIEDLTLNHVRIHHCETGLATDENDWSFGELQDVSFSDIRGMAIDCSGACTHQRWNRVQIQHLENRYASGTAAYFSPSSQDVRIRDLTVRDIQGDGLVFAGARPSITNAVFSQISGTSLRLDHGGYVGRTDILADGVGLEARVGDGLLIERSLLSAESLEAVPFRIAEHSSSSQESALEFSWSRLDVPKGTLRLAGDHDQHAVTWTESVFWFREPADRILLPNGLSVAAVSTTASTIERTGDSILSFGAPYQEDLFSSTFSGGETTRNEGGSRTITSGSQIRGNTNEPPYVLGEDDRVHLLSDPSQAKRWYPTKNVIETIGDSAFGSLLRSADMTEPPGTLIKSVARPHVFLVTAPNVIRWITTEALARLYAGPRWQAQIIELPDDRMTHYPEGVPITSVSDFEQDDVLRRLVDPADLFER